MKRTYEEKSRQLITSVKPTTLNLQPRGFAPPQSELTENISSLTNRASSENLLAKLISTPTTESSASIQRKPQNRLKANRSQSTPIQAKLNIGEPNDKYEKEADDTASKVVQQINSPTHDNSVQKQESMEAEDEELQMKPAISKIQRDESMEEEDEELQMKSLVQRRENIGGGEASTDLESSIQSARGSGQSLDAGLQTKMGQAMGADFSDVKVHTDSQSDQLNRSIQAKAFTTGQDVFFRQGAYSPSSRGGQLIAHELTHVVQQNGGAVQRSPLPQQHLSQYSAKMPLNFLSSIAKESLQRITHTVAPNPPVVIDIGTLDDPNCRLHLQRIGRINAGHPIGDDADYQYAPGDRALIVVRQATLLEDRRLNLVNGLVAQLAALGTAADHQVQPPWSGNNPAGAEGAEVIGANVLPAEATIVGEWTAFLGAGTYSHKHPRTGVVDNTRLVSADGQRSIRYGNHERNSNAGNHHFHQETWVHNAEANTVTVNNTLRRASVR